MVPTIPSLLDPRDVTPANLAILLALASQNSATGRSVRAQLRDRLLELTVAQAIEQTDYYNAAFGEEGRRFVADELAGLPLLSRGDLVGAGPSIRSRYADFGFCSYTSGTSDHPLIIYKSRQEQRYLWNLFRLLRTGTSSRASLVLSEANAVHGRKLELPGDDVQFPVSLASKSGYRVASELLGTRFLVAGELRTISMIAGSTRRIRQLTTYLTTHDRAAPADQVSTVSVSGQYLSRSGRTELAEFWRGAKIVDSYTLTEMFGGADRCDHCEGFHFSDFVVPEVVGLDSPAQLFEGRGRLVLTTLYPFTQMTPLIRYLPGDLVDVKREVCPTGRETYWFLGRALRYLRLADGAFVTTADVEEALAGIREIRRIPDPAPIPDECKLEGVLPAFRFVESSVPDLALELSDPSSISVQRRRSIIREVDRTLRARLFGLVGQYALSVTLHAPGELGVDWTGRA